MRIHHFFDADSSMLGIHVVYKLVSITFSLLAIWTSISIFNKGFLLTRYELNETNKCENPPKCWEREKLPYNKVILLIIDALRYDFTTLSAKNATYLNKMPVFRDIALNEGCGKTKLFRFEADAPTTTMQRIKGMFTGGFPTFIDVSNNFASGEIMEDNVLDQLGGNITFMGDDTWVGLFPDRFQRSFPFPSFDVKDLHTVDNGVLDHLFDEIPKQDWRLLIAHFLGVDHCGHRYGPLHPEMSLKLAQMDQMIRDVIHTMDNNTLLLVMGDHGMTQTGDHGGDSDDEISSALFAYSPNGGFDGNTSEDACQSGTVQQIDLVPTLSLIFNKPIPIANLGAVITPLFDPTKISHKRILEMNIKQIKQYLTKYQNEFQTFDQNDFNTIMGLLSNVSDAKNTQNDEILSSENKEKSTRMKLALQTARELCKSVWAQFNLPYMVLGLLSYATHWLTLISNFSAKNRNISTFLIFLLSTSTVLSIFNQKFLILSSIFTFFLLLLILTQYLKKLGQFFQKIRDFWPVVFIILVYQIMHSSNSFVVNEDVIQSYILTSIVTFLLLKQFKSTKHPKKLNVVLPCFSLSYIGIIRMSSIYRKCRPEQHWCYNPVVDATSTFQNDQLRYTSILALFAIVGLLYLLFKSSGGLKDRFSPANTISTKLLPLVSLCMFLDWQIQTLDAKTLESVPPSCLTFLPRCAFVILLSSAVWWLVDPLAIHLVFPDRQGRYQDKIDFDDDNFVQKYFQKLKNENDILEKGKQNNAIPAAFGLYRVLSSSVVGLSAILIFTLGMLLGEKYAIVMLLFCVSMWLLLEILTTTSCRNTASWGAVTIWVVSTSTWWFGTGHQASVTTLPWSAAFVGVQGSHGTVVLPAIMVGCNVFASEILHTVLLPLLVLWPITRGHQRDGFYDNEYDFIKSPRFWGSIHDVFVKYLLLHAAKLFCTMLASLVLRRHLMVWQIFAPRYLFQLVSFLVVCVISFLTYLFIIRVVFALERWIMKTNRYFGN